MKQQITDKKLRDKRFRRSEEALIGAFFSEERILSIRVIMKKAKISRSTLNRHHKAIYDILPDYEEYIMKKYNRLMKRFLAKKNIKMKTIYYQVLVFIVVNRWVFENVLVRGGSRVLEKMIGEVTPKMLKAKRLPAGSEKMLKIYEKEVVGVLEIWIRSGILENEMGCVLKDIMFLTDTIDERLMRLKN